MPASSIQVVVEIIREFKLNQILTKVTELLRLILAIPVTSASYERSSSSLKRVFDYMRCSQIEQRLSNLMYISLNKEFFEDEAKER